jgi:hypothetical protein
MIHDAWLRHQQARWLRPDAYRWIRHDVERFLKSGTNPADVFPALDRKYSPGQPRVPAGQAGGGRWTDEEDGGIGFSDLSSGAEPTDLSDCSGGNRRQTVFWREFRIARLWRG